MRRLQWLAVILVIVSWFAESCQHTPFNFGELLISENCSPDTAYFVNEAFPIINSNCAMSGCHDAITHEEGVNLSSWDAIMNSDVVKPGNANGSKLIEVLTESGEEAMPPDGPLSSEQIDVLKLWINQGALNNECLDGNCDTTSVHFGSTIDPLINIYCEGCHSGSSPSGGIKLTTYSNIADFAASGQLLGAVEHSAGYEPMPPGSSLTNCKTDQIRIWIENGYPND